MLSLRGERRPRLLVGGSEGAGRYGLSQDSALAILGGGRTIVPVNDDFASETKVADAIELESYAFEGVVNLSVTR